MGVAVASSGLVLPQPKISCDECTREMHALAAVIRQFAPEMEEFLKAEYCPAAAAEDEHLTVDRCTQDLADSYPTMLQLVVQHFFNDGALTFVKLLESVMLDLSFLLIKSNQDHLHAMNALKASNLLK